MRFWCNILGGTRPLCPQHFWSDRLWRTELPLPCVRRPGAWEWEFQVGTSLPPTIARWACICFFGACNILGRTRPLFSQSFVGSAQAFRVAAALFSFAGRQGMGFLGGNKPPPYNCVYAFMRFWCNIFIWTRTLCPQIFGAIGSGVSSCRCLCCIRRPVVWNGIFRFRQAPPHTIVRWACIRL